MAGDETSCLVFGSAAGTGSGVKRFLSSVVERMFDFAATAQTNEC